MRQPGGILIKKGMRVGIALGDFAITINDQGVLTATCNLSLGLDLADHWLRIARGHVDESNRAKAELDLVWPSGDDDKAIPLLETEFMHGMQAVSAAAFALDAFYAYVKDHVPLPKQTRDAWRRNGTSRAVQLSETFRRAFRMDQKSADAMRKRVMAIFTLRDLAVHPSAGIAQTLLHPRFHVGMEWRFVRFRAEQAQATTGVALSSLWQLCHMPKSKFSGLVEYCRGALPRFDPIMKSWEAVYGPLYDHAIFEKTIGRLGNVNADAGMLAVRRRAALRPLKRPRE